MMESKTVFTPDEIIKQVISLGEQVAFLARLIPNNAILNRRIDETLANRFKEREERLTKLRDDAVKVIRLLVDKDIISQEELNEIFE